MAGKRDKPEYIVLKLRQVEVLQGQGMAIGDAVHQIGVTQQTNYRWRRQYGGMIRDQLKRLPAALCDNENVAQFPRLWPDSQPSTTAAVNHRRGRQGGL